MEDEEDASNREKTKGGEWSRLEKLVGGAEPRIRQVASDLVGHFEARTESIDAKP